MAGREPSPADFPPKLALDELVEKLAAEGSARWGFDMPAAVREMVSPPSADVGDTMSMLNALSQGAIIGPSSVCAIGRLIWLAEYEPGELREVHRRALRMEHAAANSDWRAGWDGTYNVIVQAHARLRTPAPIRSQAPARRPLACPRRGRTRRPGRRVSRSAGGGGSSDSDDGEPGEARQQHLVLDHPAQPPRHSLPKQEARCAT